MTTKRRKKTAEFAADDAAVAAVRCLVGVEWPADVCRALTCRECNAVLVFTDSSFKWGKGTKRDQYWSCPNMHGLMIGDGPMIAKIGGAPAKSYLERLKFAQSVAHRDSTIRGPADAPMATMTKCPQCLFTSLLTDEATGVERCVFEGCGYRRELETTTKQSEDATA